MADLIRKELNLLFIAIGFFSRIPLPKKVDFSEYKLNQASRYFSLVGLLLAVFLSAFWYVLQPILPNDVTIFLVIGVSLLLTGAFHEDGLADTADGFGGAFEKEKKLAIMKDSRIGTYGAAALITAILGKFILLSNFPSPVVALLIAYPLSRAVAGSLIFDMTYVSDTDTSKSKPLANQMQSNELAILLLFGTMPLLLLSLFQAFIVIFTVALLRWACKQYLIRQIGGYTGDCLGAVQQVSELALYLVLLMFQYQFCAEGNLCT